MNKAASATFASTTTTLPIRHRWGAIAIPTGWAGFAQYAAIALAFRLILFGDPLVHVDEQFYLLVADRWHAGALPYVDIWDRKPIGLFLLYRLFVAMPGDPVVVYQVFGIASTAATALVIRRLAGELAPAPAAWLAGLVYTFAMPGFSCAFGQAPVFYNLIMALAAWGMVEIWKRPESPRLMLHGAGVMLLVGMALQVKYSVLFEGFAFGLMLLARAWADVWSWRRLVLGALVWSALALLPTLAALAAYAAIGQMHAFVEANFVSIFQRLPDGAVSWFRLCTQILALTPYWLAIFLAPRFIGSPRGPAVVILRCWAAAAVLGYLVFGTWYDHYVAPMLVPLSVLAAPALDPTRPQVRWFGRILILASGIGGLTVMGLQFKNHGRAAQFDAMTQAIRSEMHGGCFFEFDGEPLLYRSVNACIPTKYAFSSHLNTWTEAPAIGTDQTAEVARIMRSRPDVVVIGEWDGYYLPSEGSRGAVRAALAKDYERYAGARLGTHQFGLYRIKR